LSWWENRGTLTNLQKHVIQQGLGGAGVSCADIDQDGDLDVINANRWWENITNGSSWKEQNFAKGISGVRTPHAFNLNNSGYLEIIAGSALLNKIVWWELFKRLEFAAPNDQHIAQQFPCVAESLLDEVDVTSTSRFAVVSWARTGSASDSGAGGRTSEFDLSDATTITFNWELQYWFQLDTVGLGSVDATSDWHTQGSIVTLTAAPNDFRRFSGWSGDVPVGMEMNNPLSLTMDQARSVTATFDHPAFQITVNNPFSDSALIQETRGTQVVEDYQFARAIAAVDLDQDGRTDVLATSYGGNRLNWFKNLDAGNTWSNHVLSASFSRANDVTFEDLDGDGDLDVLATSAGDGVVAWWEQPPSGTWTQRVIKTGLSYADAVDTGDFDGDGNPDVVAADRNGNRIAWWRNDGQAGGWSELLVDTNVLSPRTLVAIDVDGDIDLIGTSNSADAAYWYENQQQGANWTRHLVGSLDGPYDADAADIDGDGDVDVAAAARNDDEIIWWEQSGSPTNWVKHTLVTAFQDAYAVHIADADGDGDADVFGGAYRGDLVAWWENNGTSSNWVQHTVDDAIAGVKNLATGDFDDDGHMDLAAAAWSAHEVVWWPLLGDLRFLAPMHVETNVLASRIRIDSINTVEPLSSTSRVALVSWERTGSQPDSNTGVDAGWFDLTNDTVVSYHWTTQYWVAVITTNGIVQPGEGWFDQGQTVSQLALADPGYRFTAWSGGVSNRLNPLHVDIVRPLSLNAGFETLAPQDFLNSFGWSPAESLSDHDGDGMRSWEEGIAGTHPLDNQSVLRLKIMPVPYDKHRLLLQWPSVTGRVYHLFYTEDLRDGMTTLPSPFLATPPTNTFTNNLPLINLRLFRLGVERAE
jgi:hypothetical protein